MRNDHLGYAITWFSLALVGLVMFAFYQRIPENKA
jgi:cytochrome oxidase assembly protein ShyY1